jgi:signal transduction histidine kinase
LNAIIGFSEVITNETFGPIGSVKYREYTNDIHESGHHLLGLINDILDLSKVESGTEELHEDKIEIPEIISSALKMVRQRAEQGGIKLEIELRDQLPALRADERKLKQILVNLLSNAIKFTDAGGNVTLSVRCRMDSGYVFQIADTGIGIAPEDIPKALSRFGQVDGDLNRQFEGTGLGLPLTKALVELHGGALDLQSEVGVGTTVTVRFPAERLVRSPHDTETISAGDRKAG